MSEYFVTRHKILEHKVERLRDEAARLRAGLRLCIGQHTGRVWTTVPDADVDSYVEAAEAAKEE